ncbi:MAG TPA: permease [Gaiellaceae bacterium]|nr:permease [Gaiellaceae bacterium]
MWLWHGIENALHMTWEIWWALVLGFLISAIVQASVPRERLQRALGGRGGREAALATGLGAASSSCSYAAIAIAKTLFEKGASLASAMAFQFASTNLVFELGVVLWLLIGWQFTLAEYVGGLILIAVLWIALRAAVDRRREERVREHAAAAATGHVHPTASGLTAVAHNFRNDWQMLWKEIVIGLLIAGYVATLPHRVFDWLFVTNAPQPWQLIENVLVAPVVAALAFVCSIGNVPVAAVLWASGISFGGVIAFLFADLLIPPIVVYYRRVYGRRFTTLLVAVMYGAIVAAALAVDGLFSAFGLIPSDRPSVESIAERPVTWNYTSVLDLAAAVVFIGLFALTLRRGARDPVCGMTVERGPIRSVHDGTTFYFCCEGCKGRFDADPEAFSSRSRDAASDHSMSHG